MQEHEKARRWREAHNLTPEQLARLTGYTRQSIYWFERGTSPPRWKNARHEPAGPIREWVWQRYKRACEGVQRELTQGSTWMWEK